MFIFMRVSCEELGGVENGLVYIEDDDDHRLLMEIALEEMSPEKLFEYEICASGEVGVRTVLRDPGLYRAGIFDVELFEEVSGPMAVNDLYWRLGCVSDDDSFSAEDVEHTASVNKVINDGRGAVFQAIFFTSGFRNEENLERLVEMLHVNDKIIGVVSKTVRHKIVANLAINLLSTKEGVRDAAVEQIRRYTLEFFNTLGLAEVLPCRFLPEPCQKVSSGVR